MKFTNTKEIIAKISQDDNDSTSSSKNANTLLVVMDEYLSNISDDHIKTEIVSMIYDENVKRKKQNKSAFTEQELISSLLWVNMPNKIAERQLILYDELRKELSALNDVIIKVSGSVDDRMLSKRARTLVNNLVDWTKPSLNENVTSLCEFTRIELGIDIVKTIKDYISEHKDLMEEVGNLKHVLTKLNTKLEVDLEQKSQEEDNSSQEVDNPKNGWALNDLKKELEIQQNKYEELSSKHQTIIDSMKVLKTNSEETEHDCLAVMSELCEHEDLNYDFLDNEKMTIQDKMYKFTKELILAMDKQKDYVSELKKAIEDADSSKKLLQEKIKTLKKELQEDIVKDSTHYTSTVLITTLVVTLVCFIIAAKHYVKKPKLALEIANCDLRGRRMPWTPWGRFTNKMRALTGREVLKTFYVQENGTMVPVERSEVMAQIKYMQNMMIHSNSARERLHIREILKEVLFKEVPSHAYGETSRETYNNIITGLINNIDEIPGDKEYFGRLLRNDDQWRFFKGELAVQARRSRAALRTNIAIADEPAVTARSFTAGGLNTNSSSSTRSMGTLGAGLGCGILIRSNNSINVNVIEEDHEITEENYKIKQIKMFDNILDSKYILVLNNKMIAIVDYFTYVHIKIQLETLNKSYAHSNILTNSEQLSETTMVDYYSRSYFTLCIAVGAAMLTKTLSFMFPVNLNSKDIYEQFNYGVIMLNNKTFINKTILRYYMNKTAVSNAEEQMLENANNY